jgi:MFS family permease
VVALNRTADWGVTSAGVIGLASVGSVMMALFAWQQSRATTPVLELGIFKSPAVVLTSLCLVLQVMGQGAASLVLPFFMVHALDLSATISGVLFAMAPAFMFIGSTVAGRLSDRIGAGPVMVVGMFAQIAGAFILVTLDETSAPYLIGVALAVMGAGSGFLQTSAGAAQMNAVPPAHIGMASALFIGLIMLAATVGGTLGGILMSAGVEVGAENAVRVAEAYNNVAWAGMAILLVGTVCSIAYWAGSRGGWDGKS